MTNEWSAQVHVKWTKDAPVWENWNWLNEWKEVKWAFSTMGEWDMVLWLDVSTPKDLEEFVHQKLWNKKWVSNTKSTWTKEVWSQSKAA